jgi:reductive dehalogenase
MSKRELVKPKYEIVGELERIDRADTVMARRQLIPDSELWQSYYRKHPDLEAQSRKWADLQKSRKHRLRIAPQDELMENAMRFIPNVMAKEEYVDGEPSPEKIVIDPKRASSKIKGFARHLGADLVKIGPFNPSWTYKNISSPDHSGSPSDIQAHPPNKHAIVVAIAYKQDEIECAPRFTIALATGAIYLRLSTIVVTLARYIRSLGYEARAHNHNSQVLHVPLAIDAGFGELARNGIFITEEYGSAIKPMTVTTDMPLIYDRPVDIGVDEFCSQCDICVKYCPAGAIHIGEKKTIRGVKKWSLNASACFEYFLRSGANCSLCVAYCPWTRPRTFPHNFIIKAFERSNIARKSYLKVASLLYRKKKMKIPSWQEEQPEEWRKVMKPNHPLYR